MLFDFTSIKMRLESIEEELRKLSRTLERDEEWKERVDQHLIEYNAQLKVHIEGVQELKETNKLLREHIDKETTKLLGKIERETENLQSQLDDETRQIQSDLEPVKKHVNFIQIIFKYFIVPVSLTLIGYLIKLWLGV